MVGIPGVDVPDLTPQFVDDAADWTGNAAKDSADFVAGGVAGLGGFVAKTVEGGWDLIEDEFEEIKAEAERGLAWLKDQAAEIADYATNPVGDSAALRTSAGAWAAVAEALGRERDSLEGGKRGLAGAWKGPNGDSYLDGVTAASDAMGDVAEQALKVQKLLENGADTIDELNKQVQLLVVEILATITLGAVIGLITGGLGLAAGGARVALVVRKVKALVDTARKALLVLRVAQVVRLSAIGYKLRKTFELARAGNKALRGAENAVKASKAMVAVAKSMLGSSKFGPGARKFGRGARKAGSLSKAASNTRVGKAVKTVGKAVNPINTKKKRIVFGSSTASSAITTSLATDPKDWTAEDIARIVAGGYLSATAGDKLTKLLKGKRKLGEVGAATVSSAIFGTTASAGTQAAFNEGRVDWTRAAVTGVASGVGGGIGRVPVRSRLASLDRRLDRLKNRPLTPAQRVEKKGLELQKERLKAAGRLGPEAIGEGLIRNQGNERIQDLRASDAAAGKVPKIVVPKTPGLDLPKAPVLHTIRPGESLSSIAGDRLDDPDVWRRIREANPGLTDPDLIHPGDRVAIPRDLTFRVAG